MKLLVDIPDNIYNEHMFVNFGRGSGKTFIDTLLKAIKNGKPIMESEDKNMKECNIEKVNEVLKSFLGAQIEFNDSVDADIEELENKLEEFDHDITIVLKDMISHIIVLEEKVERYESQNVREDINKLNMKIIRINKNHTTDINGVQHRLNILEKEKRRNATNK